MADFIITEGTRHFEVNEEENRVQFLDSRYYKCKGGEMVPSVTTILEAWPKGWAYYEWLKKHGDHADEIRDEAGERGSTVHALTESYDKGERVQVIGESGRPLFRLSEWAMLERWVEFTKEHRPEHKLIEVALADAGLGYAGTLDRLSVIEGDLWLLDIKTSNALYDHYDLQLAAYAKLLERMGKVEDAGSIRRGIVWLNARTRGPRRGEMQGRGWQVKEATNSLEHDLDLFNACHAIWNKTHEGEKPKEIIYQLSHQKD